MSAKKKPSSPPAEMARGDERLTASRRTAAVDCDMTSCICNVAMEAGRASVADRPGGVAYPVPGGSEGGAARRPLRRAPAIAADRADHRPRRRQGIGSHGPGV